MCPQIVRQILGEGHEIGIHSYTHDRFLSLRKPSIITQDLEKTRVLLEQIASQPVWLFRPPVGHVSPRTAAVAQELGLHIVAWSVKACDGLKSAKPDEVAHRVIRKIAPGAIVLMHDASELGDREPASIEALERVLLAIASSGLQTVAVSTFVR
jgi:peptidoglycan/xylan/chitin deacetylase (PgdA/CDA1 family)